MTDECGNPLYPSMLYTDPRGSEQVTEFCKKIDVGRGARAVVHEVAVYRPRKEKYEQYRKIYDRYKGLYTAVRGLV